MHPVTIREDYIYVNNMPDLPDLQNINIIGDKPRLPRYVRHMSTAISTIRNLGPAYEDACKRAGIHSAEELRTLGADASYARLLASGSKPHFIGYYVLVMALQGRPWNDCKGDEKKALRKRFDAIKASSFDVARSEFESILNQIGVIEKSSQS